MENTKAPSLTLDGVEHEVAQFSPAVQQAVTIYNSFNVDLQKAQLEVLKHQSAMQSIGTQIAEAVKKELAAKEAPEAEVKAAE